MTVRSRKTLTHAVRGAVLGVALFTPMVAVPTLLAQAAIEAPAQSDIPAGLLTQVENYWHYGKIGRYDLQTIAAEAVLAQADDPQLVLRAFEKVVADREEAGDKLEEWIVRWQTLEATRTTAQKINEVLMQGRLARRADPAYIQRNIDRLGTNEVGYRLGLEELRNSGELAIPLMLDVLRDPTKVSLHGPVGRAMRDLGKLGLNPLVAATDTPDNALLPTILLVLGDLGYDAAAPYIAAIAEQTDRPAPVREAATRALEMLKISSDATAGALFHDLAEKLYYDRSALTADPRYPVSYVWQWKGTGLVLTQVPPPIFNEIMSMRAAREALSRNANEEATQSLWLAANYKRELELPAGATDNTQVPNAPSAHFYGVASGAKYLNNALARALRDRNPALALSVIRSLQEIGGESNLALADRESPLIDAMQYPDRRVRFEAAFALAGALPQKPFQGQETVVPLLAEAISQTGKPTVLLVMPSQDAVNAATEPLRNEGFVVAGATTAATALAAASALPAVDVIVVSDDLPAVEIEQLFQLASGTPKLGGSGRLVLVKSGATAWEQRKLSDTLLSTAIVTDPTKLLEPIKASRDKAGSLPMDPAIATEYARRAGELLKKVAISRGQIYDLSVARHALLNSLDDERPEIVMLAGQVLGLIDRKDAQSGLVAKAAAAGLSDEVKVSLLKSLATSARFFGNLLDAEQVAALENIVAGDATLPVKDAAAEARGALNLPPEQSKALILNAPTK